MNFPPQQKQLKKRFILCPYYYHPQSRRVDCLKKFEGVRKVSRKEFSKPFIIR